MVVVTPLNRESIECWLDALYILLLLGLKVLLLACCFSSPSSLTSCFEIALLSRTVVEAEGFHSVVATELGREFIINRF